MADEPDLKRRITPLLVAVVVVGLFVLSAQQTDVEAGSLLEVPSTFAGFATDLYPPDWSYWREALFPLLETIQIAVVATTIGALLSVPAGFLAASNVVSSRLLYRAVRFVMSLVRTLPEVILAVVFVTTVGLGSVAGVLALSIFTFGFIAKLFSESIEAIDPGPVEAIRASGGNLAQIAAFGMLPQVMPQFLSYSLYSFEVNVRVAVVLSIVGAGGIGQQMLRVQQFFQYDRLAMIILMLLVAVILIDLLSNSLRRQLI